ncbi:MAG TPA: hypothetical protein VEW93_09170 [Acidimicrobiales bacterium]|jgi:hypothetical protein|nr:hypothetical protein [Acidimicrobiales bacterium]
MPPGPGPGSPPPTPSSPVRTALIVVGGVAAGGVVLVMVLVGAVTFLGTSSPETRFEPIDQGGPPPSVTPGSGDPDDRTGAEPDDPDPEPDPGAEPDDPETAAVTSLDDAVEGITIRLEREGWEITSKDDLDPSDGLDVPSGEGAEPCDGTPIEALGARALEGEHPDVPGLGVGDVPELRVEVIAHPSTAEVDTALGVLTSEAWRTCVIDTATGDLPPGSSAHLELLPADPGAPGVAYGLVLQGPASPALVTNHIYVLVGSMRGYVFGCGCDPEAEWAAARHVAAALASVQDLPVPG